MRFPRREPRRYYLTVATYTGLPHQSERIPMARLPSLTRDRITRQYETWTVVDLASGWVVFESTSRGKHTSRKMTLDPDGNVVGGIRQYEDLRLNLPNAPCDPDHTDPPPPVG